MTITPNSKLWLLKDVNLDPNYNYTMDFDSLLAQENYFNSKIDTEFDKNEGYSYIRDNRAIKVEMPIDKLFGINYLMFENEETNKRYYAFITSKEWLRSDATAITIKIDPLQSFMFDYELEESFIEREHQDRFTSELTPIINNVRENVDYGGNYQLTKVEKILSKSNKTTDKINIAWVIIICNDKLTDDSKTNVSSLDNYYYYAVPFESPETQVIDKKFYFKKLNENIELENAHIICKLIVSKNASKIVSIKLYENCPFSCNIKDYNTNDILITESNATIVNVNGKNIININSTIEKDINGNDSLRELNTYNLKLIDNVTLNINNAPNIEYETKLYSDPYYFILMTNHNGEGLKINPKGLANIAKIPIYYIPVCSPDSKIMYYIKGYYGDNEGRYYNYIDNSVNEIALTSDKWQEYLSQNKASATAGVAVNLGASALTTAIGAFTANPLAIAGGVLSFGQNVANTIIRQQDIKQEPNSVKSQGNNASFALVRQILGVELEFYSITEANKKRLFNYFNHYGYQCNDFKKPNLRSRYYFNYIKTIGANINTGIDADFRNELVTIYDNGITIFHYRDSQTFKGINNYNYENVEMNLMEVKHGRNRV